MFAGCFEVRPRLLWTCISRKHGRPILAFIEERIQSSGSLPLDAVIYAYMLSDGGPDNCRICQVRPVVPGTSSARSPLASIFICTLSHSLDVSTLKDLAVITDLEPEFI